MKRTAIVTLTLAALVPVHAQRPQSISREVVILAEDRRAFNQGDYELLVAAATHPDASMRAAGIRALGRIERSHPAGAVPADLITRALAYRDAHVRRVAAYALAQSVSALDAAAKTAPRAALLASIATERDDAAAAALLESAARLADAASLGEVERAVMTSAASGTRGDAVASALEILARRAGKPGALSAGSIDWLRGAVFSSALSLPARHAAMQALLTSGAVDAPFATRVFATDDWQLRRMAIAGTLGTDLPSLIERALRDVSPHVRFDAVRIYARRLKAAGGCVPLVAASKDPDQHVALAAIDSLDGCADPAVATALAAWAIPPGGASWHRASHALVALAKLDPARARELLAAHAADPAWPVRMYAAAAAAVLGDDLRLETLSGDAHPNVREAAINGLVTRASMAGAPDAAERRRRLGRAVRLALAERRDPQLLRTAARSVAATGDAPSLKDALRDALDALDAARVDTAIDARTAIAEALKLAAPGETIPPAPGPRVPMTPSVQELQRLPARARIEMARGGIIELELLPDEAPATVARFARLAQAGYFDGLTLHRVEPNFVVQGGSPWANEYAGAPRFQRDELGFARHERGAVGISTRGRDSGDAQIFIDLVDLPRLNHNYTVFARVASGMDAVDQILEADVIQRISILK